MVFLSQALHERQAVGHITPKGGDAVYWILTFHIGRFSVSIRVMELKSRNRHSAK